jgi:Nuclease-related domain
MIPMPLIQYLASLTTTQCLLMLSVVTLLVGFWCGNRRQKWQENQGEGAVRRRLTQVFHGPDYHLMNNVTLPDNGGTTQIDHILMSRYGIFVLEAKHYRGVIHAEADAPRWTQAFSTVRHTFQNPRWQNYKHVQVVKRLVPFVAPAHIHSLVVFTGTATFPAGYPQDVYDLNRLVAYLRTQTNQILTVEAMERCIGRLEHLRKRISGYTDVEHQAYLNRKFGDSPPR